MLSKNDLPKRIIHIRSRIKDWCERYDALTFQDIFVCSILKFRDCDKCQFRYRCLTEHERSFDLGFKAEIDSYTLETRNRRMQKALYGKADENDIA